MYYLDNLLDCYELSASNFQSCYKDIWEDFGYCVGLGFEYDSVTNDTMYLNRGYYISDSYAERRQSYINSKGGIKVCFDEMCERYDKISNNLSKLEGHLNNIIQYSDELSQNNIDNDKDIALFKRLKIERTGYKSDYEYAEDLLRKRLGVGSGKKLVLKD